jgi:hypothetical protein
MSSRGSIALLRLCLSVAALATACNRASSDAAGSTASAASGAGLATPPSVASGSAQASGATARPLVEEREDGSLSWIIRPDGSVRVTVRDATGHAVVPPEIEGSVTVREASTPMWNEGDALVGALGALEDDLTDVTYSLKVKGVPWQGALQVPSGGTDALVADSSVTVPPGTVGPNGGMVEVIGDQRVEILGDPAGGELRVYLLDDKLAVMPVGDAEITVGFVQ